MYVLASLLACTCDLDQVDLAGALEAARRGSASRCEAQALARWVENRKTTHGPWYQDIGVARSTDGLAWTALRDEAGAAKVVLSTAAVPEAVVDTAGQTWLFYVDGSLDGLVDGARDPAAGFSTRGLPGLGALAAARSADGLNFQSVPVQIEGLQVAMFADPEVVPEPTGGWRMYYLAMSAREYAGDARWGEGEKHEIHSATSTDLVHWKSGGIVLRGPFADPTLACFQGGGCTLFSYGIDASYSRDGRRFDYAGRWTDTRGFAPEAFAFSPTDARLYYNDAALGAPLRAKRSADGGHTWGDEAGVSLDVYGEAVTVLRRGPEDWWMYFHTFKPGRRLATVPDLSGAGAQ